MSIEEKIRTSSKKPLALELSPQQAAEVLGVHPRTIRNMIANKQLEAIKVNRKWYIKSQSVARVREVDSKIVEPKHKKYEKGPKNLAAFRLCLHAFDSFDLSLNGEEIDMRIKARQLDVIENLGSGYYSYGGEKLRYYRRARASLGAIIGLLSSTRCASSDSLCLCCYQSRWNCCYMG